MNGYVTAIGLAGLVVIGAARYSAQSNLDGIGIERADLPDGHVALTVRNTSSQSISAIAVVGHYLRSNRTRSNGALYRYFDSVIDPNKQNLSLGQSHTFYIFGSSPAPKAQRTAEVAAVIFADGRTEGDPKTVAFLLSRRTALLQELNGAIALLNSVRSSGSARQAVMNQIKQIENDHRASGKPVEQRLAAEAVYGTIDRSLTENPSVELDQLEDHLMDDCLRRRTKLLSSEPPIGTVGTAMENH